MAASSTSLTSVVELLVPVAVFVASIVVFAVRDRLARGSRRAAEVDESVTLRSKLSFGDGRFQRGHVRLEAGHVLWLGRRSAGFALDGAEPLGVFLPGDLRAARPDDLVVRLRLPGDTAARLLLHGEHAAAVVDALRSSLPAQEPVAAGPVPQEGRKRPRWALICVVVAAVWLLGWLWLVVAGETRTATVTGNDGDGLCTVTWTGSDGAHRSSEVDCDDQAAGSPLRIWALGPPFRDEAVDPGWTLGGVLALGLLVAAPGVYRLVRRARPRPAWELEQRPLGDEPRLLPLGLSDLEPTAEIAADVLARLAPYAARQRSGRTWEDRSVPAGASGGLGWREPLRALLGPLFALVLVVVLSAPWPYRWYVLHTASTSTAEAVSTGEEAIDGPGPVPDDVTVGFRTADGAGTHADVATTSPLPKGTAVEIEYARDKPGWARRTDSHDGLALGAALGASGTVLAIGWGLLRVQRLRARTRAQAAALAEPGRPRLALLTADPDDDPTLLVVDPLITPTVLTAVVLQQPLPAGAAASFPADRARPVRVHGRLEEGSAVVVELADLPGRLLPGLPAYRPAPPDLLFLLDSASAFALEERELDDAEP